MTTVAHRKSTWIPWVFVIGMLVVIAANAVLMYSALSTWTGIETQDHYRKGIAYNENLTGAARQAELGWEVTSTLTPVGDTKKTQTIRAVFLDKEGAPLTALHVRAFLVRPVHEGYDQTVELMHKGQGSYESPVTVPLPGLWELRLVALGRNGETHQSATRITVTE